MSAIRCSTQIAVYSYRLFTKPSEELRCISDFSTCVTQNFAVLPHDELGKLFLFGHHDFVCATKHFPALTSWAVFPRMKRNSSIGSDCHTMLHRVSWHRAHNVASCWISNLKCRHIFILPDKYRMTRRCRVGPFHPIGEYCQPALIFATCA